MSDLKKDNSYLLIEIDKNGKVIELAKDEDYDYLVELMDKIADDYEKKGIMLFEKKVYSGGRTYSFSTEESGWHCGMMLSSGWIKKGSLKTSKE